MTKRVRGLLLSVAALVIAAVGFLAWYRTHFAMSPVEGFTVNDPSSEQRLLIATQGSAFKDAVVAGVVKRLSERPIFIQAVDVTALWTETNGTRSSSCTRSNTVKRRYRRRRSLSESARPERSSC